MRLPHGNARITAVTGKGYSEDWDSAGTTAASARWTGVADAFVVDERRNVYDGERASTVVTRSVVVPAELDVRIGDSLTMTYQGAPLTLRVKGLVEQEPPPGVPGTTVVEAELT